VQQHESPAGTTENSRRFNGGCQASNQIESRRDGRKRTFIRALLPPLRGFSRFGRRPMWQKLDWTFHLVHAVVRESVELELIRGHGVTLHPFSEVLKSLCADGKKRFTGEAGGDLAEIVDYYERTKRQSLKPA